MDDSLGDRIKSYEINETGRRLLRGIPLVARLDGKSFHTFTKGMKRPYDTALQDLMDETAKYLLEESGAVVCSTQSDEISLIIYPYGNNPDAELPYDGKVFKLTSVLASTATARFVKDAVVLWPDACKKGLPRFDCRVFEVPSKEEAVNALIWRENDALKNSVSMAARAYFSHNELQGKSSKEMQEMLFQRKGINFNDYPSRFKRGAYFQVRNFETLLSDEVLEKIPENRRPTGPVIRSKVVDIELPRCGSVSNLVEVFFEKKDPILKV